MNGEGDYDVSENISNPNLTGRDEEDESDNIEHVESRIPHLCLDTIGEVLSMVPVTSTRAVRSTCKEWNTLTKNPIFTPKKQTDYHVVTLIDSKASLMSFNPIEARIKSLGQLFTIEEADVQVKISQIYHSDGLILYVIKDLSRVVVSNPYLGQIRSILPRNSYKKEDAYALGYEKKNKSRSNKILRLINRKFIIEGEHQTCEFEIFILNSNSWKVINDVNPNWTIHHYHRGLSLDGNTYWYAQNNMLKNLHSFLLSLDFTTERFGPSLPLPFHPRRWDTVTLSSVKEKQLAVLYLPHGPPYKDADTVKIWITTKIEPNAVLWGNLFLKVNMQPFILHNVLSYQSFFVDEEIKVTCIIGKNFRSRKLACIIGKNGSYFKVMDLGESEGLSYSELCHYVPSTVQI